jgi:hypothetical protein
VADCRFFSVEFKAHKGCIGGAFGVHGARDPRLVVGEAHGRRHAHGGTCILHILAATESASSYHAPTKILQAFHEAHFTYHVSASFAGSKVDMASKHYGGLLFMIRYTYYPISSELGKQMQVQCAPVHIRTRYESSACLASFQNVHVFLV